MLDCDKLRLTDHVVCAKHCAKHFMRKTGAQRGEATFPLGDPACKWSRREPHLSWSGSPELLLLMTRLSCQLQQLLVRLDQMEEGPETGQAARGAWAWV